MLWNEILVLFFILVSFAFCIGVFVFSKLEKDKEYVKMLHQQKEYYYWATQWYYRKEKEAEQRGRYFRKEK